MPGNDVTSRSRFATVTPDKNMSKEQCATKEYKHGLMIPKTHIHVPLVQLG